MKALTLTQPWASLIAIGAKQIATRRWWTDYRGPLAIHAARGWSRGDWELVEDPHGIPLCAPFVAALRPAGFVTRDDLPRGAIVRMPADTDGPALRLCAGQASEWHLDTGPRT